MKTLTSMFLATSVVTALVLAGCSSDDGAQAPDTAAPDGGAAEDGGPGPSPGPDAGDGGELPATSFSGYVKSLVETKTSDTSLPEGEQVWGALSDDPSIAGAAFPASFFQ